MKDDQDRPDADDDDRTQIRTAGDGASDAARDDDAQDDDATRMRVRPGIEKTQILPAQGAQDTADDGSVDILVNRPSSRDSGAPVPGEDDDEDATQFRSSGDAGDADDDEDATQFRSGAGGSVDDDDADDDVTQINTMTKAMPASGRASLGRTGVSDAITPDDLAADDGEDATEFRSAPADDEVDDDATEFRRAGDDDATEFRGGRAADDVDDDDATEFRRAGDDDATQFRDGGGGGDEDATVINSRTQSMPAVGRAALGPAPDAPRLQGREEDDDATHLRGTPGGTETDATRMRAANLPSDDDATVAAAGFSRPSDEFGDDDATVQAGAGIADDDATVQAGGRPVRDEDGTVSGDDDPTRQGPPGARSAPPPSPPRAMRTVGPGAVLKGRFTLEDKLGAGGMGGVFKAVDLVKREARDRNPYVAVKVLNEAFAEHEDSFMALQRESSRSQRLTHPNIAAVYDFDRDGDVAYMVMELLEGSPLDSYLKKNKQGLEPEEARGVIRDISAALAYAHTQSPALVHSDFKPGNIFYTGEGTAKVFDFGIARAATSNPDDVIKSKGPIDVDSLPDDGEDSTLFDAGKLGALTPAYAAVEMFEGRDPAPQDDVYALGIVAYQCLTGKHPYNRQKAPVAQAQGMVPERPDGVTNREWRALRRALAFNREDRTPDAQAFLDEFFYTGSKTVLAVAATVAIMAVGVAVAYYAGLIGPQAPTADPNPDWVALESQINVPRQATAQELERTSFDTYDAFVGWEGVIRQNIQAWDDRDAKTLVLGERFANEAEALSGQKRIFDDFGLSMQVSRVQGAEGGYRLVAGPFRYETAAQADADADEVGYGERLSYEEFAASLDSAGLAYDVASDDAAIAAARDAALDVYLAEFERRLPQGAPRRVQPVIRAGADHLALPPNFAEGTETRRVMEEDNGIWVPDPDATAEVNARVAEIRAAGLDESEADRRRGPSVLARAETYFNTRPADIAQARARARSVLSQWQGAVDQAQTLATRYQAEYTQTQRSSTDERARLNERNAVAEARLNGGSVDLALTYEEFGFSSPQRVDLDADGNPILDENGNKSGGAEYPGVKPVFTLECHRPERVEAALVDFPYLPAIQQQDVLKGFMLCADLKLERNTQNVLRSKDILAAQVDYAPLERVVEPDPCGARGYVGAGRAAFCRDALGPGSAAPPVVIIDAPGSAPNFAIGKYEVSVGEFNTFAAATARPSLGGDPRLPATGVSPEDARAYADWLSRTTGRRYRLPTVSEWRHAADADGDALDPNRNCYSNVRGVVRGENLVSIGQGAPNRWGLVNHVGNAEEFALADGQVVALGGRHTDDLASCGIDSARENATTAEAARGFRILREIGSGDLLASAGGP